MYSKLPTTDWKTRRPETHTPTRRWVRAFAGVVRAARPYPPSIPRRRKLKGPYAPGPGRTREERRGHARARRRQREPGVASRVPTFSGYGTSMVQTRRPDAEPSAQRETRPDRPRVHDAHMRHGRAREPRTREYARPPPRPTSGERMHAPAWPKGRREKRVRAAVSAACGCHGDEGEISEERRHRRRRYRRGGGLVLGYPG